MSERNVTCTNQIVDAELDSGQNFHPEPQVLFGNTIGFSAPNAHPSQITSAMSANSGFRQFSDHNGSNTVHESQCNDLQHNYAASNLDAGYLAPSSLSSSSYVASSSTIPTDSLANNGVSEHFPPSSSQRIMGVTMGEGGLSSEIIEDAWGFNKRKNEGVAEHCYRADGLANPDISVNTSMGYGHHRNESFEAGSCLSHATSSIPEHRGGFVTRADGTQGSVSRAVTVDLQLESAFMQHRNHLLQENYMPHPFQPTSNWPDQFVNNVNDGAASSQAYRYPTSYLPGYPCPIPSRNAAVTNHAPVLYNHHHHPILPGQGMPTHGHSPYQVPAFGCPVNNFQISNAIASRDVLNLGPRFARLVHSNISDGTFRPPRRLQAARDFSDGRTRILHPEHLAFLDLSVFYEAGNHHDQHRDMRMDIDSMSYEELLALEEDIGDVCIGLSEECILKHLKTRIHVPLLASLSLKSPCSTPENETCVICRVEFEENERIGTLDCGHDYHADCIKQWLLVKNICPICKTTALGEEKRKDSEHR